MTDFKDDKKKAILIVDDDPSTVFILKHTLINFYGDGYIYETALDAIEAINIIDDMFDTGVKTALILSDWLMPVMKGDEFILKVHEKYPHIKTIMISGYTESDNIDNMRTDLKLNAFISKPWDSDRLIDEINKCLL